MQLYRTSVYKNKA